MVQTIGENEMILGPISNCDNGWLYHLSSIGYFNEGKFVAMPKRFYRYDDLAPISDKLMDFDLPAWPGLLKQSWIAFYAVLIPRKVWDKLGGLDPNLRTGFDDADLCHRAKLQNMQAMTCQNALIWHFGGVSADQVLTKETRDFNQDYFFKKWGFLPS